MPTAGTLGGDFSRQRIDMFFWFSGESIHNRSVSWTLQTSTTTSARHLFWEFRLGVFLLGYQMAIAFAVFFSYSVCVFFSVSWGSCYFKNGTRAFSGGILWSASVFMGCYGQFSCNARINRIELMNLMGAISFDSATAPSHDTLAVSWVVAAN